MTLDGETMDALGYGVAWSTEDGHRWFVTSCASSSRRAKYASQAERKRAEKQAEIARIRRRLEADPAWAAQYRARRSANEVARQRALSPEKAAARRAKRAAWMAAYRAKGKA